MKGIKEMKTLKKFRVSYHHNKPDDIIEAESADMAKRIGLSEIYKRNTLIDWRTPDFYVKDAIEIDN